MLRVVHRLRVIETAHNVQKYFQTNSNCTYIIETNTPDVNMLCISL